MGLIRNDDRHQPAPGAEDPGAAGLLAGVRRLCALVRGRLPGAADAALAEAETAERTMAEQRDRLARLEDLAATDELTGLLNRRGFEAALARAMAGARRYHEKGVLVFIDLDGFKPVNDTYGHAAGDEVLRQVSRLLAESVRATDFVGRLGGDEFAVVLTRTDWEAGLKRAEAFDQLVNGAVVTWAGRVIQVRASFGFQTYGPDD
ncbi:MAG: GGDEF domain-containing protein, partial [Rhodospirillales bacterium]